MVLDRRKAYEIVRALEHARRGEIDVLDDAAQTSATTDNNDATQPDKLVPTPRPHPFRDSSHFTYSGELAKMARARGVPPYEQLAENVAPGTLSRLANLQTLFGKPFDVYGAYSPGHETDSQHKLGKAFDINLSTSIPERARLIEAATQMGFTGTGTYDENVPGVPNPGVHVDIGRQRN